MPPAEAMRDAAFLAQYKDAKAGPPEWLWVDSLAALLADPPPWANLEGAEVAAEVLASVPIGPTLVIGMGGSALGARAALRVAAAAGDVPHTVEILDTVDPETVRPALDWAQQCKAALHVVSKSGATVEVLQLLEACLARQLGPIVLLSGAQRSPLRSRLVEAQAQFLDVSFPDEIGGRYSVLTAVGQIPLQAAGLAPGALLEGARDYLDRARLDPAKAPCTEELAWHDRHPAAALVVLCYADALLGWGEWLQQLWCESLGRLRGDGSRVGELVTVLRGPAAQHGVAQLLLHGPQDKRVVIADFRDAQKEAEASPLAALRAVERDATFDALTLATQRVLVRPDLRALGALMMHGMLTTVVRATHLGISPYGQPAVEAIKRRIADRLEGEGRRGGSS